IRPSGVGATPMKRLPCVVGVAPSVAASMTVSPCGPPPLLVTTTFWPLCAVVSPSGNLSTSTLWPAGRMHHPVGVVPTVFGSARQLLEPLPDTAADACRLAATPCSAPAVAWSPVSWRKRSEPRAAGAEPVSSRCAVVFATVAHAPPATRQLAAVAAASQGGRRITGAPRGQADREDFDGPVLVPFCRGECTIDM